MTSAAFSTGPPPWRKDLSGVMGYETDLLQAQGAPADPVSPSRG
jgi:hypothetical protein